LGAQKIATLPVLNTEGKAVTKENDFSSFQTGILPKKTFLKVTQFQIWRLLELVNDEKNHPRACSNLSINKMQEKEAKRR
jgi:hypothetical protein